MKDTLISSIVLKSLRCVLGSMALVLVLSFAAIYPASAGTPSEQINIISPPNANSTSTICGAECLTCCNCCPPGTPQAILTNAYQQHRNGFILGSFYNGTAQPAMRRWADQLTQTWIIQARMIGGFYDAQNHHNAQLDLQRLQAETLRDYTPSDAVCQFGTLSRSLAATSEKVRANQLALSEINLVRGRGGFNNIGGTGRGQDNYDRMTKYREAMCDNTNENSALSIMCDGTATNERFNRDIDYARTLATPETLRLDFTNATVSTDEESLILLGHNLYGHKQFLKRLGNYDLDSAVGQNLYGLVRSVTAKRALAENSFNALAAMKATGAESSRGYVDTVLANLGMSAADRNAYVATLTPTGNPAQPGNPSYYAQMDILTKRVYQNPGFYAELMDKRANVARQQAAMEGLELMQDRDIFTSMQRSEQLLGALVEMEAMKLQSKVQNNITPK